MIEIAMGVMMFSVIILSLVLLILLARHWLIPNISVDIIVNQQRTVHAAAGAKLLNALAESQLYLASACGGGGTLWSMPGENYRRCRCHFTH